MIKKILCLFIALTALLTLNACSDAKVAEEPSAAAESASQTANSGKVDIDVSAMSSSVAYSQIYNMHMNPDDFTGQTVKIKGPFGCFQDKNTGNTYYYVLFSDNTACCSTELEFVWNGDHTYPDDYPADGQQVTVTGVFEKYYEGEKMYVHLITDSVIF